jgi:hypothetical protein
MRAPEGYIVAPKYGSPAAGPVQIRTEKSPEKGPPG